MGDKRGSKRRGGEKEGAKERGSEESCPGALSEFCIAGARRYAGP